MSSTTDAVFNPEILLKWSLESVTQSYQERDTMLYALGVGAAHGQSVVGEDLGFVYEKNLSALPTMAVVLATPTFWVADPALGIQWKKMLHGEQRLTLHRPLAASGTVTGQERVIALFDKGAEKGSVMLLERVLRDASSGDRIATIESTVLLRGNGGFGGRTGSTPTSHKIPDGRLPDLTVTMETREDQALLYRLSGDYNPLHIDPDVAHAAGFQRPILHGLCSYAIAGRVLLKQLCDNQSHRLRRLDVRFVAPVYPGETLRIDIWRESHGRAAFCVKVAERNTLVLNNGYFEYSD